MQTTLTCTYLSERQKLYNMKHRGQNTEPPQRWPKDNMTIDIPFQTKSKQITLPNRDSN